MSKPTHNHKLTLGDQGMNVETIAVTSDPLTPITYMEVDEDGDPTGATVQAHNESYAKFSSLAKDLAVIHLREEGSVVVGGITKTRSVLARLARNIGGEAEALVLELSAEVPTPMTTDEVNREIRTATVETMREDGASDEEVIAFLLS